MIDVREFRRVCYEAAQRTGGKMVEFRIASGVTPNFHQGIIGYVDCAVAVICNRELALLTVAQPRDVDGVNGRVTGPVTFVDAPALAVPR